MKKFLYIIVAAFAVGASTLTLSSCSDDDTINSAAATVSMGQSTYSVKENKGLFTVPVMVSGEQNGDIKVTVEVKSLSANCIVDENVIVTSTEVVIPSSKKSVNIEIKSVDDRVINDDRQFSITLVHAEGATISETEKTTLITLLDNDDIPYDRMDGEWIFTAVNMFKEDTPVESWETRLTTVVDDDEPGYGSVITMSPWTIWSGDSYDFISHTLLFKYNASSETATVTFKLGEKMSEELVLGGEDEDGFDLTNCTLRSATSSPMSGYTMSGSVVGTVNSDFTEIKFNLPLEGIIFDAKGVPYSPWFLYESITMTKK